MWVAVGGGSGLVVGAGAGAGAGAGVVVGAGAGAGGERCFLTHGFGFGLMDHRSVPSGNCCTTVVGTVGGRTLGIDFGLDRSHLVEPSANFRDVATVTVDMGTFLDEYEAAASTALEICTPTSLKTASAHCSAHSKLSEFEPAAATP